jgi:hypothetical protein
MAMGVYPKRPPRLELFANTEPFYFVTFNTYRRMPVFWRMNKFSRLSVCFAGVEMRSMM